MKPVNLGKTLAATMDRRVLAKRSGCARTVAPEPGPDDYFHAARRLHDAAVAMTFGALWSVAGRAFGALRNRLAGVHRRGRTVGGRHQAAH